MLVAAVVVLWLVVLVLCILMALVYRQFGLMYIGSRARVEATGPSLNKAAPRNLVATIDGAVTPLKWAVLADGCALVAVIFGGPICPLCADLVRDLDEVADRWVNRATVIFLDRTYPGVEPLKRIMTSKRKWRYGLTESGNVHQRFNVDATPFAVLMDPEGRVVAKGLVNTGADLNRMILTTERDLDAAVGAAHGN